jgi:Fe-S cluster assembly iron-binding protein IscA
VTVTPPAGAAIRRIAAAEGKKGCGLSIVADREGGFCMEFSDAPGLGDNVFTYAGNVQVFASPETLWRIGGAVIDFRGGRITLDLP